MFKRATFSSLTNFYLKTNDAHHILLTSFHNLPCKNSVQSHHSQHVTNSHTASLPCIVTHRITSFLHTHSHHHFVTLRHVHLRRGLLECERVQGVALVGTVRGVRFVVDVVCHVLVAFLFNFRLAVSVNRERSKDLLMFIFAAASSIVDAYGP
jgi:hypothetical protein